MVHVYNYLQKVFKLFKKNIAYFLNQWKYSFFGKKVLTLSQTSPGFYVSAEQAFWKHCGKRRNCS